MDLGKAGRLVEGPLLAQDLGAKFDHVVPRVVGTQHAVHLVNHPLEATLDVQDGEGDEQAVAGGVDEGGGGLEGAAQIGLALRAQGIGFAAYTQDLRGDGVASGMVGAHGGGGVGDADALHSARLVSRHALALDHRAARHAQDPGGTVGAGAQDAAHGRALAHLVHQLDGLLAVTEFGQPTLHSHRQRGSGFDGVQAILVAQPYHLSHVVQVTDAAVGAQGPG